MFLYSIRYVNVAQATDLQPLSCSSGTLCFELFKGIPTAAVVLAVGLIAAWIAYQQYRVARAKLNLDLFEKRYAIFEKTWEYLSAAVQTGPPTSAFGSPFDNLIPQASFLFGPEIADYMRAASSRVTDLWLIDARTRARNDIMPPTDIDAHTKLQEWFLHEAQRGAKARFGKYLDFGKWH